MATRGVVEDSNRNIPPYGEKVGGLVGRYCFLSVQLVSRTRARKLDAMVGRVESHTVWDIFPEFLCHSPTLKEKLHRGAKNLVDGNASKTQ